MSMLEVKDLQVYYGVIQALKGISFEAEQLELRAALAATDHTNAHRENGSQVKDVKYSFNDCTHRFLLLFQIGFWGGGIYVNRTLPSCSTSHSERCSLSS